jgi:magnesium chelatase accessory protein
MANWNLTPLVRDLPRLKPKLTLVGAEADKAVPAGDAKRAAALVAGAEAFVWSGCGHLAHEERPDLAAQLIEKAANAVAF